MVESHRPTVAGDGGLPSRLPGAELGLPCEISDLVALATLTRLAGQWRRSALSDF